MFVEKIKFIDFVEGFENGSEIHFGNEQSELLDFYINSVNKISNNEKEVEQLSKRVQINCILGQNGAGKTKLLSNIIHFFKNEFSDLKHQKEISFSDGSVLTFKEKKDIGLIFDDFFVGSDMFKYSINNKLANDFVHRESSNIFYCEIYNFLKKDTHKEIFSNFLNLDSIENKLEISSFNSMKYFFVKENTIFILDNLYDYFISKNINNFPNLLNYKLDFIMNKLGLIILLGLNSVQESLKKMIIEGYYKFYINQKNFKYLCINKDYIRFKKYIELFLYHIKYLSNLLGVEENHKADFKTIIKKINNLVTVLYSIENNTLENYDYLFIENVLKSLFGVDYSYSKDIESNFLYNIINNFEGKESAVGVKKYKDFTNLIFKKYYYTGEYFCYSFKSNLNLTPQEKQILSLEFFNLDLRFTDSKTTKSFNNLSSGEKIMLMRFVNIYKEIYEQYDNGNGKKNFIILIDEPDLHLHLEWQREYIQRLVDVFSTIKQKDITMHFIIATHSPFIISDIPSKNLVKLERYDKNGKQYSKQVEIENNKQTFGANYIDIIRNGFFKNGLLVGSFSREIINNLSLIEKLSLAKDYIDIEKLDENERKIYNKYVKNGISIDNLKEQIGDEFIKNNLVYLNFNNDKNRHG